MTGQQLKKIFAARIYPLKEDQLRRVSQAMGYAQHGVFLARLNALFDSPYLGLDIKILDFHLSQKSFILHLAKALDLSWTTRLRLVCDVQALEKAFHAQDSADFCREINGLLRPQAALFKQPLSPERLLDLVG
jgi:hypothetical protein